MVSKVFSAVVIFLGLSGICKSSPQEDPQEDLAQKDDIFFFVSEVEELTDQIREKLEIPQDQCIKLNQNQDKVETMDIITCPKNPEDDCKDAVEDRSSRKRRSRLVRGCRLVAGTFKRTWKSLPHEYKDSCKKLVERTLLVKLDETIGNIGFNPEHLHLITQEDTQKRVAFNKGLEDCHQIKKLEKKFATDQQFLAKLDFAELACDLATSRLRYSRMSENARKAYKMMENKANFYDAKLRCEADGAWLVMPKTEEDIADIREYGKYVNLANTWIGIRYLEYVDGTAYTAIRGVTYDSNDTTYDCVTSQDADDGLSTLVGRPCAEKYYVLCEYNCDNINALEID